MNIQDAWNKRLELRAESAKLRAEGDIIFLDAVIAAHGNVKIRWDGSNAIVEGVRYEAPKE